MSADFWIDTMRDKMTGKLDKCEHGRYGYEDCSECATAAATEEIERLLILVAKREDLCGRLTAENARLCEMVDELAKRVYWQTIDTAPSDGREVLVCGGSHMQGTQVRAADGEWWRIATSDGMKSTPTHWMEKPAPFGVLKSNPEVRQ